MAGITLELRKQRVSERNGMTTYKADNQRSTGSVYFDKKMFPNGSPETLTVIAEGIAVPQPKPTPAPAAEQTQVAEAQAQEQPAAEVAQ